MIKDLSSITNLSARKLSGLQVIGKISPPKSQWVMLKNFKLEKIPFIFSPTSYQRDLHKAHTNRIILSIINHTFYDNTIRVVKLKKGYQVIDGQHRLAGLWILHSQYGLQTYDLAVQIFSEEEQREVFRKINSGRNLSHADILRSLDEGKQPFFEELKLVATHKVSATTVSYIKLLQAIWFGRGNDKPLSPDRFKEVVESILDEELNQAYRVGKSINKIRNYSKNPKLMQATFIRVVFRVGSPRNYSSEEYEKLIKALFADETFNNLLLGKFTIIYKEMMFRAETIADTL